ncbi:MAG: hypothetical protein VKJ04_00915 [Vampirovibrionales bacterium]|nr:hypothetical protein [Vampirovibrionales bacterium]
MTSPYPNNPTFDDYRKMAKDESLSCYEKIAFPDAYRKNTEVYIFEDILNKLTHLNQRGKTFLDIGPGCSTLPQQLISLCEKNSHTMLLVDSEEMLTHLPDKPFIQKIKGPFPQTPELLREYQGKVDCLLSYSLLHLVHAEASLWHFVDTALSLLAPGGECLFGDVPNMSKRKRFFASENGVRYHQNFTGTDSMPDIQFNSLERGTLQDKGSLDDALIFGLMLRARSQGFDAYILPQDKRLPLENRREDLLFRRP